MYKGKEWCFRPSDLVTDIEQDEFDYNRAVGQLLLNDVLLVNSDYQKASSNDDTKLFVVCSDTFAHGGTDSIPLPMREVKNLFLMWFVDPVFGTTIWAAMQRKRKPLPELCDRIDKAGFWLTKWDDFSNPAPTIAFAVKEYRRIVGDWNR